MSTEIVLTMGDPTGVGPEVICKALAALSPAGRRDLAVIGDGELLERANRLVGAGLVFEEIADIGLAPESSRADRVPLYAVAYPERDTIRDGTVCAGGGHAAFACVAAAVDLCRRDAAGVIVTAPLSKAALHLAGHHYDGHTGMLRDLTGAPEVYMLLASERLSTIHVSTHVSLGDAVQACRAERIVATLRAGVEHLRALGMSSPRVAVAGLNPHAGEAGLFGDEDRREIEPAVAEARALGIDASGPWPGDTVFLRASRGEFDLVVAQYHDQGHIPTKLIAFETAVNVTLGLPLARTSVDHGTAHDIAWTGRADARNMLSAIAYARRIAGGVGAGRRSAPAPGCS